MDFGYAGQLYDPTSERVRKAWVFVMTLGYSRHQYAELVFDQKVETWVELHVRALESFGGVVKRIVILKAGIVKAVVHDQEAQRSYRELAEHYGFLISPCRPHTPEHHNQNQPSDFDASAQIDARGRRQRLDSSAVGSRNYSL